VVLSSVVAAATVIESSTLADSGAAAQIAEAHLDGRHIEGALDRTLDSPLRVIDVAAVKVALSRCGRA